MGSIYPEDTELTVSDAQSVDIGGGQGSVYVGPAGITVDESVIRVNGVTIPTINLVNSDTVTISRTGDIVMFAASGGGGGGGDLPIERVSLTLNPSEREVGSGAVTITGSFGVSSPYTFVGTGSQNGSGGTDTLSVTGGAGTIVPVHTNLTDTTFTFNLTVGDQASSRAITVHATIFGTYNSAVHSVSVTTRLFIADGWYTAFTSTQPTGTGSMTNQGVFTSPKSYTQTTTVVGGRTLYMALPTRSNGYVFTSGSGFLTQLSRGVIDSNWTLYEIPDVTDGQAGSITLQVAEA